jgi:hypothetical protein
MRKSLPGRQRTGWSRVGRSHVTLALAALALVRARRHSSRFCWRRKKRACVIVNAVGVAACTTRNLPSQLTNLPRGAGARPEARKTHRLYHDGIASPRLRPAGAAGFTATTTGESPTTPRPCPAELRRRRASARSAQGSNAGIRRAGKKASHEPPRSHRGDATALLAPHWLGQLREPRNQVCESPFGGLEG